MWKQVRLGISRAGEAEKKEQLTNDRSHGKTGKCKEAHESVKIRKMPEFFHLIFISEKGIVNLRANKKMNV
jgi:hypothetical protein